MIKKGFTLIELLAVIAIISILATIGVTAVIKIYNDSVKKTMIVQENNVAEASKSYLEDYCIDPLDNTYRCPSSYENNSEIRYICLSDLQDNEKGNYVSKVNYKNEDCKGIITFSKNDDGEYIKAKTYLYCDYDTKAKKYNYVTDESLDTSKYPICNIASGITDPKETTSTTSTTTKKADLACTFNGELMQGSEYTYGPYTYRYKQEGIFSSSGLAWRNMANDGWGVQLTNKSSSAQITEAPCTSINSKNVTSYAYLYEGSAASSINVTFNSANVTNMQGMFKDTKATSINLTSLNTSKVINMISMFEGSNAISLNLNSFNTTNVVSMISMFRSSSATALDLSSFDTKNVTDMSIMFNSSNATTLNLSSFNTSNVRSMGWMFQSSKATTLNLNNFNTSNVSNMQSMFESSSATTINISNFNTSKITNMSTMFHNVKATILDLSSFDTRNVTNMNDMFGMSKVKTIYVGSNFITNKVTSSTNMFKNATSLAGGFGTKYNSSKIDKTYARIDSCATPGYFTNKNSSSLAGGTFETDSWATIISNVRSGQTCMYKVGDTKSVSVGTYGTHTVRISNMSTPSECRKSNFSQTACGFVLEFADIITSYKVNDTDTYKGGWPACKMRTFVNNNIYNALPSDLKSGIINTKVITGHGSADSQNLTSTDKLYLLSTAEVWENGTSNEIKYDTARDVTRQLDYYKQMGTTTNNYSAAAKKMNSGGYIWRLRTAWSFNPDSVYGVERSGDWYSRDPEYTGGVSPAFRIG